MSLEEPIEDMCTISRLLHIIGLFCSLQSLLQGSFAKETYHFQEPTNRSRNVFVLGAVPLIRGLMKDMLKFSVEIHIYSKQPRYTLKRALYIIKRALHVIIRVLYKPNRETCILNRDIYIQNSPDISSNEPCISSKEPYMSS